METWVRHSRHLLQVNWMFMLLLLMINLLWLRIWFRRSVISQSKPRPSHLQLLGRNNYHKFTIQLVICFDLTPVIFECLLHFSFFFFFFCWGISYSLKAYWRGGSRGFVKQPDSTLNEVKEAQGYCSAALDLGLLCLFGSASLQGRLFAPRKARIISN